MALRNVAARPRRQKLEQHVNSNKRSSRLVDMPICFQPGEDVGTQKNLAAAVNHSAVGVVVVTMNPWHKDSRPVTSFHESSFRGYLVVRVCLAEELLGKGVVLRELLVGGRHVAGGHQFTDYAGIFRFSHVVVNISAPSIVSGFEVILSFDVPYIKVPPRVPTPPDGRIDPEVDELRRHLTTAIDKYLFDGLVPSECLRGH